MRLSRRDALAALAALGGGARGAGALLEARTSAERERVATMTAVAEVVYPDAVDGVDEFVETYAVGRGRSSDHGEARRAALAALDDRAEREHARAFAALPPARRRVVLRSMGVDRAHPNPDGTLSERVRHYVVDDLLYALFTTPVGGRLVGIENPPGYPGGREAYQRGEPE
jgi:hypothetical protein